MKSYLFLLSTAGAFAAQNTSCTPASPVCHTTDNCSCTYCLGPAKRIANAPVRPFTCNGDWEITLAGFYWKPDMEGLEFAVENLVRDVDQSVNLIKATYETPNFKWDFGFKLGLAYNTTCDGWDIGVNWTYFVGRAHSLLDTRTESNHLLIPLWSDYALSTEGHLFAEEIEANWKLHLNLIDLELGREYWVSPRLSMRPFVGLRIAFVEQDYHLNHRGGTWSDVANTLNNKVELDNDFNGVGLRSGFDLNWRLGCGWSVYSEFAAAIVYGQFDMHHDEKNQEAVSPFDKFHVAEVKDHFRASRAMVDLALGVQWYGLFCECQYGIGASLGWEQHILFHQNQLFRVRRLNVIDRTISVPLFEGENGYTQAQGTLATGGWTLTVKFDF